MKKNYFRTFKLMLKLCLFFILMTSKLSAQVTLVENTTVTNEALFFWKADDPKPYHYGAAINPHGNCVKVSNGYVFYTWYKGGFADRTLMVSRKKIGEGNWVHVALPGKLSLVAGKGDTHLTTNIGICPIDGTVHIMYDHHNENLNYIVSKKNIAFAADSEFNAGNFEPQRDYLVQGKTVTGVTYPKMISNDQGELFFERRNGSAVGGDMMVSYYDGNVWSGEIKVLQGTGAGVTQGERNYCYGKPYLFNGDFYYVYSVRWAESPTRLNEGVYIVNLGPRMKTAKTLDGKSYSLPITDHAPFLIADPRSVPDLEGWAGGPDAAISPKNDIYLKISPKNTPQYNYLRVDGDTEFAELRDKGGLGEFYGNRMFKCTSSNGVLTVQSCQAGSYTWRTDYTLNTGINVQKSQVQMDNGKIVAIYAEKKSSDKVPIYCYVFDITKPQYTAQTITFDALPAKSESDPDFTLEATATSALPVKYTSSNIDVAQIINGNTVTIKGVGSCVITASQRGDGVYNEALEVEQTLVVNANTNKSNQTIDFVLQSTTHVWGNSDEVLSATATSGLPVEFESTDIDVAEIINGKLHVKRAGSTVIRALQAGDDTYNAAPIVSYTLTVPKQTQVITLQAIPSKVSGDPEFNLVVSSNNPSANLRFVCPNNQVAVVWSDIVRHLLGPGNAVITVSDSGNDYFTAASVQKTLVVTAKTHAVPSKIEAEHFSAKNGVSVTRWSNTVFYLNAWNANDYSEYNIDVPEDGVYPLDIRAACPNSAKRVQVLSASGSLLASVSLAQSASLTAFKTTSTTVSLKAGVQKIKLKAIDGGFNLDWLQIKAKTGDVTPPATGEQAPHDGAINIPGVLQFENYDFGGEGVSYHDIEEENLGGVYRTASAGEGVDLKVNNGSYAIYLTKTGEWVEYTINVAETAVYNFDFSTASSQGGSISASIESTASTPLFSGFTLPNNGDWNTYVKTLKSGVPLSAGQHVLRISFDNSPVNLDKVEVTKDLSSAINEVNSSLVSVFPNPSSNGWFSFSEYSKYSVYTIAGHLIFEGEGKNMNLSEFSKGSYLLKINDEIQKVIYK